MMQKKGAIKAVTWAWIILGVVFVGYMGWIPGFSLGGGTGTGTGTITVEEAQCGISDTTLSLSAVDFYSPTTALGSSKERLFLGGVDKGNVSNGGTTTISPLDPITVYYGRDSQFNEADGVAGSWYYAVKETSPAYTTSNRDRCTGALSLQGELRKNGSISFTFYNEDGTAGSAQAMTTSTEYNVEFQLKAPANAGYGNPAPECANKNIACLVYNSTTFNSISVDNLGVVSPTRLIDTAFTDTENNTIDCFNWNPMYDNEKKLFNVAITTSDVEPVNGDAIAVVIDDCDLDLNADTGAEIWGLEDEDRNNLGATYQKVGELLIT